MMLTSEYAPPVFRPADAGDMTRAVLNQDVWWQDRKGVVHLLDEMSPSYRHNLCVFLWCNRQRLWLFDAIATVIPETVEELHAVVEGHREGVLPHQQTPAGWLQKKRLMCRLVQVNGGVPDLYFDGEPQEPVTREQSFVEFGPRMLQLLALKSVLVDHLVQRGATFADIQTVDEIWVDMARAVELWKTEGVADV